ncbi:hypothetical protein BJ508DRAFT_380712 [Ascobolus immersus RN42]|uniref:Uncharacterized protein n=1 Tax=Ascobolus immersus RN42 TaxID=1160509 RepID=A0A3N4HMR8_ASCIM|nr:hypothetical protein BJ508DRAFT_380712 [Ascobolus immersus RN42]
MPGQHRAAGKAKTSSHEKNGSVGSGKADADSVKQEGNDVFGNGTQPPPPQGVLIELNKKQKAQINKLEAEIAKLRQGSSTDNRADTETALRKQIEALQKELAALKANTSTASNGKEKPEATKPFSVKNDPDFVKLEKECATFSKTTTDELAKVQGTVMAVKKELIRMVDDLNENFFMQMRSGEMEMEEKLENMKNEIQSEVDPAIDLFKDRLQKQINAINNTLKEVAPGSFQKNAKNTDASTVGSEDFAKLKKEFDAHLATCSPASPVASGADQSARDAERDREVKELRAIVNGELAEIRLFIRDMAQPTKPVSVEEEVNGWD